MTAPAEDEDRSPVMTFFEHLGDLRRALFRATLAFVIALAAVFPFAPRIFQWLTIPLRGIGKDPAVFLQQSYDVTGAMQLVMSTALWGAFVVSLPFMLMAIAGFIFPGLTARERRVVSGVLLYAVVLFAAGVALAAWAMLGPALKIMMWFGDWMGASAQYWWATDYVRFILMVLATFGLTFELPVVVMLLGRLGIVTAAQLREKRRHALVFIMILAAVVTPTQDPFSLFILALPLGLLYEISIWTTWMSERKKVISDQ